VVVEFFPAMMGETMVEEAVIAGPAAIGTLQ
jgi:hypothetical protein